MKNSTLCTVLALLFCFLLVGCEAFKEDPNIIAVLDPHKAAAGPDTQMKGKNSDVEVSVVAWSIDMKYEQVEEHYLKYFEEKGFKKFDHGQGHIFQNDVVECMLLPKDKKARAELRVARILNEKPMPAKGVLTTGI